MITFSCLGCAKSFSVKDEFAGKKTKCPQCHGVLVVPITVPFKVQLPSRASEPAEKTQEKTAPPPWRRLAVMGGTGCLLLVMVLGAVALLSKSTEPQSVTSTADSAQMVLARPSSAEVSATVTPQGEANADHPKTVPVRFLDPDTLPDNLELPPVGPTKAAADDEVDLEFKKARAAWESARKQARAELPGRFRALRDRLSTSLAPAEKANVLKAIQVQLAEYTYGPGQNAYGGPLPTHPQLQGIVAEYWQKVEIATQELGRTAEKGLAAYDKAGVTDPAKRAPLLAACLAARNVEWLGIWGSPLEGGRNDSWIVDVAEWTGEWRISGSLSRPKGTQGIIYHAEKIQLKDGTLSFLAQSVDTATKQFRPGRIPMSLKLREGKLYFEVNGVTKIMQRTGEEVVRNTIEYWGAVRPTATAKSTPVKEPDLTDANYVWRKIADLSSFSFNRGKFGPYGSNNLYLPYRSKVPTVTPGAYGVLTDMLVGQSPGGGKNREAAEWLFGQYDRVAETPYPYLKRTTSEFLALSRARFQLAEADELFGNTPNSSIREFQQKLFLPAVQYVFQRDADRAVLQEKLQKEYPGQQIVVLDAPLSAESQARLKQFLGGASGFMEDLQQRAEVSGLLAYADMTQVERAAQLWQTWLIPLAKRCAGPVATVPLLAVEGEWKLHTPVADGRFHQLKEFKLRNVSGRNLQNVVIEVVAENEWGEKAPHYIYMSQFEVAEVAQLLVQPRWERRRLPFTNTMKITWSVWADQGTEVNRQVKLTNPMPNPDSAGWRKDYLEFDRKLQAEGEALGAIVRNLPFLPVDPNRQRRRLLEFARPGNCYAVRLTEGGKFWAVRFRRLDTHQGTLEIEVSDFASRKPFSSEAPVWKGDLKADKQGGFVIRLDSGWTLFLGHDDHLNSSIPQGDGSPVKLVPLVRVKLP